MKLTEKLKSWMVKSKLAKADATDPEMQKAVAEALTSDDLSFEKYYELSITDEDKEASEFKSFMSSLGDTLGELKDLLKEDADEKGTQPNGKKKKDPNAKVTPGMEDDPNDMPETDVENEENQDEELDDDTEDDDGKKPAKGTKPTGKKTVKPQSSLDKLISKLSLPMSLEDGEEQSTSIRVKSVAEQYDKSTKALIFPEMTQTGKNHPLAGKRAMDYNDPKIGGRPLDVPSDLDKAVAGAYAKFMINHALVKSRDIAFRQMPQHDKDLLLYAMDNMRWGGASDGGDLADIKDRKLTPTEQKALIDDSTSGGITAAPIVFDDQVIQTPLLNGELFPLVTQVPLDRGRRVEGVATAVVTGSWGGVDDTAIPLFDTTSYVTAFDTTIYRWQGAFRIGLDFLSDTPIDFGQYVTAQYGERLLKDLDDVIATGNGTTQPEGVMVHAGTTSINFGGTTTLGNYESLRFGVTKQEHRANLIASAVFCGTETSYQRALAIPVGASDARRLSQTVTMPNYDGYSWMQRPYKINSSLSNSQIFYAILARYRMYRRRGMYVRTSSDGDTLLRANELLILAMARYGGQLERGGVCAVTSTAPA